MAPIDEKLTETVRSMYEEFPFPNTEYQMPIRPFAAYFAKQARKGGRSLLSESIDVIDAGCGTAAFITNLAQSFSESRFVGVDMTEASLKLARDKAAARGLGNLSFEKANILTLDLGRKFDVVMNLGVLHHLADPAGGLARLAAHVADDGYLVLWLYGKHGRYRLNLNQKLIDLLATKDEDWRTRIDIAKRALVGFPDAMMSCHFSVADQKMEDDFSRAREWILKHDQWVADQFVHPHETVVDMDDILKLTAGIGFRVEEWFGVEQDASRYTPDPDLQKRIDALEPDDRLRALDLLIKPNYYFVVARRR